MATPTRTLLICSEARSGTTWLSQMLASTGVLGRPGEYFHLNYYERLGWIGNPAKIAEEIVRAAKTQGTTPNGICALRVAGHQFANFSMTARLSNEFPDIRYLRVRRQDLLAQAISLDRAKRSRQWATVELPHLIIQPSGAHPGPTELEYDGQSLQAALGQLITGEASWDMYFARSGIVPLTLTYEDVVADAPGCVQRVADLMEVAEPIELDQGQVSVAVQRDDISREWRDKFVQTYGDPDRFLPLQPKR